MGLRSRGHVLARIDRRLWRLDLDGDAKKARLSPTPLNSCCALALRTLEHDAKEANPLTRRAAVEDEDLQLFRLAHDVHPYLAAFMGEEAEKIRVALIRTRTPRRTTGLPVRSRRSSSSRLMSPDVSF